MSERLLARWQQIVAALFALAIVATPILAFAQGGGTTGGGGGGTGSGAGGPPPGGTPGGGAPAGEGGGARGLAWIAVVLAIAIIVYLFTRRRREPMQR